jgi:hypothetical protein
MNLINRSGLPTNGAGIAMRHHRAAHKGGIKTLCQPSACAVDQGLPRRLAGRVDPSRA